MSFSSLFNNAVTLVKDFHGEIMKVINDDKIKNNEESKSLIENKIIPVNKISNDEEIPKIIVKNEIIIKEKDSVNKIIDDEEVTIIKQSTNQKIEFSNDQREIIYQLSKISETVLYQELLQKDTLLNLLDFINEIGLTEEMFMIDEFWKGWNKPDEKILVNKTLLDWLGYEGTYSHQKERFLKILKRNFQEELDYIRLDPHMEIESINPKSQEKPLFVTYLCLKEISIMVSTKKAKDIRNSYLRLEILFKLYIEYISSYEKKMLNEKLKKLNQRVLKYEKKHTFKKFKTDLPMYYICDLSRLCSEDCNFKGSLKHGISPKGINARLKTHRTTLRSIKPEFLVACPMERHVELLEDVMAEAYEKYLTPKSSEAFYNISVNTMRQTAIKFLDIICPNQYIIIEQKEIDEYNDDVDELYTSKYIKDESNEEQLIDKEIKPNSVLPVIHTNNLHIDNCGTQNTINVNNNNAPVNEKSTNNISSEELTDKIEELKQLAEKLIYYTGKDMEPLVEKFHTVKGKTVNIRRKNLSNAIHDQINRLTQQHEEMCNY